MMDNAQGNEVRPDGVDYRDDDGAVHVSVRTGSIGLQPIGAALIALVVALSCTAVFFDTAASVRSGEANNSGPLLVVLAIVSLLGWYGAILCVWSMVGYEKLTIRNGMIRISRPWLFGLQTKRSTTSAIGSFVCSGDECDSKAQGGGCCCGSSATEGYWLSFHAGRKRVSVFNHLPNDSKDWIRDRLNQSLRG